MLLLELPGMGSVPANAPAGVCERTYTIAEDRVDAGSFPLIAADNVGNTATDDFLVVRDALSPTLGLSVTHLIDAFVIDWEASDSGAGLDTLAISHCDLVGENCVPLLSDPPEQGSTTFSGPASDYTFQLSADDHPSMSSGQAWATPAWKPAAPTTPLPSQSITSSAGSASPCDRAAQARYTISMETTWVA